MSGARKEKNSFQGQLFAGSAQSKTWEVVSPEPVALVLQQNKGEWKLIALKQKERVWETVLDVSFKHRLKENFVQWQQRGKDGAPQTHGLRFENTESAKKFSEALATALSSSRKAELMTLRIIHVGKEILLTDIEKGTTAEQLLKAVAAKQGFNPSKYALALPPDSAHGKSSFCPPNTPVEALGAGEVHLVRKDSKHASSSSSSASSSMAPASAASLSDGGTEQTLLFQVHLPNNERTVVRVPPTITLDDLLQYTCSKRNLNPSHYCFDVSSSAHKGKTLQQLKVNSLKMLPKDSQSQKRKTSTGTKEVSVGRPPKAATTASSTTAKSAGGAGGGSVTKESPQMTRKHAPPPPPPSERKAQPKLMRELTEKVASVGEAKKRLACGEGGEGEGKEAADDRVEQVSKQSNNGAKQAEQVSNDAVKQVHPVVATTATATAVVGGGGKEMLSRKKAPPPPVPLAKGGSGGLHSLKPKDKPPPSVAVASVGTAPNPLSGKKEEEKKEEEEEEEEEGMEEHQEQLQEPPPPSLLPPPLTTSGIPASVSVNTLPGNSQGDDEPDSGPGLNKVAQLDRCTLDTLVSEVAASSSSSSSSSVREVRGQLNQESIAEGLKKQAIGQGRYLSIRKKSADPEVEKGEKGFGRRSMTQVGRRRDHGEAKPPSGAAALAAAVSKPTVMGSKRKAAPLPPKSKPVAVASALTKESTATATTPNRPRIVPARKAPSRPPPGPHKRTELEQGTPVVSSLGSASVTDKSDLEQKQEDDNTTLQRKQEEDDDSLWQKREEDTLPAVEETDFGVRDGGTPKQSIPSRRYTVGSPLHVPDVAAVAVSYDKDDGGKVFIVRPSPKSVRKSSIPSKIVFNLPPPPPSPLNKRTEADSLPPPPPSPVGSKETTTKGEGEGLAEGGREDNKQASFELSTSSSPDHEANSSTASSIDAKAGDKSGVGLDPSAIERGSPELLKRDENQDLSAVISPARTDVSEYNESIEFTNFDDLMSSSVEEVEFDSSPSLQSTMKGTGGGEGEGRRDEVEKGGHLEYKEGASDVRRGSKPDDESDDDLSTSSASDSESMCGFDFVDMATLHEGDLPPMMSESEDDSVFSTVNNNNNNNNNNILIPPPPGEFFVPSKPSLGSDSDSDDDDSSDESSGPEGSDDEDIGEGGEIKLVSVAALKEEVPPISDGAEEEEEEEGKKQEKKSSSEIAEDDTSGIMLMSMTTHNEDVPAIIDNTVPAAEGLDELDSMISSLNDLATTEETPSLVPPPPPPPPLPPALSTAKQAETVPSSDTSAVGVPSPENVSPANGGAPPDEAKLPPTNGGAPPDEENVPPVSETTSLQTNLPPSTASTNAPPPESSATATENASPAAPPAETTPPPVPSTDTAVTPPPSVGTSPPPTTSKPKPPPATKPKPAKHQHQQQHHQRVPEAPSPPKEVENELLVKLKQRQDKLKAEAAARSFPSGPDSNPLHGAVPQTMPLAAGLHSVPGTGSAAPGGDHVQAQLQFLQQQVLQQQMMQLQQQMMHMNQNVHSAGLSNQAAAAGLLQPGFVNQPGLLQPGLASQAGLLQPSQVAMLQPGFNAGMLQPGQAGMPGLLQPGQAGMPGQPGMPGMPGLASQAGGGMLQPGLFNQAPLVQQSNLTQYAGSHAAMYSNPAVAAAMLQQSGIGSHQQTALPLLHQQQLAGQTVPVMQQQHQLMGIGHHNLTTGALPAPIGIASGSGFGTTGPATAFQQPIGADGEDPRRPSRDQVARSQAMGSVEQQFDELMEEVRDSPSDFLKKVPESDISPRSSSSYTGMAAALEQALKQRRHHLVEKHNTLSLDESSTAVTEWETS